MKVIILLLSVATWCGIGTNALVPIASNIKYYLYNAANPNTPVIIDNGVVPSGGFDPTQPIKVLIHGWLTVSNDIYIIDCKNAYFTVGVKNVIVVDWTVYSNGLLAALYLPPLLDVGLVGQFVGDKLLDISSTNSRPLSDFHVMGLSLGAHIAGIAGQRTFAISGVKLDRITGLDPAGPGFFAWIPDGRLSENDAVFVDVIHSSTFLAGYKERLGHVDFYPNGGVSQRGCSLLDLGCSHNAAFALMTESIMTSVGFYAWQCTSWTAFVAGLCCAAVENKMGEPADRLKPGVYYLNTNAGPRRARGNVCP